MATKKRWEKLYQGKNPFALPQAVASALRTCQCSMASETEGGLQYLWIYACEDGSQESDASSRQELSLDEWLSVVDEAASLGAKTLVVSARSSLSSAPDIVEVCRWAQSAHDMMVGVHVYERPLPAEDVDRIMGLDLARLCLFVDNDLLDSMRSVEKRGVKVFSAQAHGDAAHGRTCTLPQVMPCVGSRGSMYTCGLVLGEDQFKLGNVFDRKLATIMKDEALPHTVPAGIPENTRQCNGCPPLMARRLESERP